MQTTANDAHGGRSTKRSAGLGRYGEADTVMGEERLTVGVTVELDRAEAQRIVDEAHDRRSRVWRRWRRWRRFWGSSFASACPG